MLSYGISQYNKTSAYTTSFNVSEAQKLVLTYQKIWTEVELQFFEQLTTDPIKTEGKYMHGKLKTYIKMFHMYFKATAILKVDTV